MKPVASLRAYNYISSNYDFSEYQINVGNPGKVVYVASENLNNYCTVPYIETDGYLYDWSPRKLTGVEGFDNVNLSFSVNPLERSFSFSLGKTISIEDEFVDGTDYTNIQKGYYKVKYDYKKYNKIGYCSKDRKKVVFGTTTVKDAVQWRNKKSYFYGYVYSEATFTVCDSNTWPDKILSETVILSSNRMTIK